MEDKHQNCGRYHRKVDYVHAGEQPRGPHAARFRAYGGTCALRGCDPKKMLIGGVEATDHVRRSTSTLQRCAGVSHPGPQGVASICSVT
jgi:hypothetical protein